MYKSISNEEFKRISTKKGMYLNFKPISNYIRKYRRRKFKYKPSERSGVLIYINGSRIIKKKREL